MSFSNDWEEMYKKEGHLSVWPWSDLVSFVMRHARPNGKEFKVLELGCGAGANIPFFKKLGVEYYAIEGSPSIIQKLKNTYPEYKDRLATGDFTKNIPFDQEFDLIVDRASLTCNPSSSIKNCLNQVFKKLKTGGKYIGIDWYSTHSDDFKQGERADDENTRTKFTSGVFRETGKVHFSDKAHLLDLFKQFQIIAMDHKILQKDQPSQSVLATWNFVAEKN